MTAGEMEATHNLNGNGIQFVACRPQQGNPATYLDIHTDGNLCLPESEDDIAIWGLHAAGAIPTKAEHYSQPPDSHELENVLRARC